MRLVQLSRQSIAFPSPEGALREPNGLLALGGDLSPSRLLMAYQHGIFPWFSPGDPILWWSPDPRAVLWPGQFHLSRSMKRFHQRSPYRVTLNHAFGQVIEGCANNRDEGTWITSSIVKAYHQLHELGHAHSIEVWQGETLVGGMYGVAQGALFCGESMFSRAENASKTALLIFCQGISTRHRWAPSKSPAAIILMRCRYCAPVACRKDSGCPGCYLPAMCKCFQHIFYRDGIIAQ